MNAFVQEAVDKLVRQFKNELLLVYRNAIAASLNITEDDEPSGAGTSAVTVSGAAPPEAPAKRKRGRPPKAEKPAKASRAKALKAKGPKAKGSKKGPKSTPAEVNVLCDRILDVLKRSTSRLSASELRSAVKADNGPFQYALNKLKDRNEVRQIGDRRLARYELGGAKAKKATEKSKGKGRGAAAASAEATEKPAAEG